MTPEVVQRVINAVMYYMREHADAETKQPFITMIHGLIQQVVIGLAENGNGVELHVHGPIVSNLATMDTIKAMEAEFRTTQEYEYHALVHKTQSPNAKSPTRGLWWYHSDRWLRGQDLITTCAPSK